MKRHNLKSFLSRIDQEVESVRHKIFVYNEQRTTDGKPIDTALHNWSADLYEARKLFLNIQRGIQDEKTQRAISGKSFEEKFQATPANQQVCGKTEGKA